MLSFIILACTINVTDPDINSKGCKEFRQTITEEHLTPYSCMMQAQPQLAKFFNEHPGWIPRRYTCVDLDKKKNPKEKTSI